jgi:hypothetical protein
LGDSQITVELAGLNNNDCNFKATLEIQDDVAAEDYGQVQLLD